MITGPITLVLPFDTADEALPFRDNSRTAIATTDSAGTAASDTLINGNSNTVAGTPELVYVSAATTAAENAARENGLEPEHPRVALAAAIAAEVAAARVAASAEGIAAAVKAMDDDSAAAAAAAAGSGSRSRGLPSNRNDGGVSSNNNSNRSEFAIFDDGGGNARGGSDVRGQQRSGGSVKGSVEVTGADVTKKTTTVGGGRRDTGLPFQISFVPPKYARPTVGLLPATSYGNGGSETISTEDIRTMMSQYSAPSDSQGIDTPGSTITAQRQAPPPWIDDPPAERPQEQKQPQHLVVMPKLGNGGVLGRGEWLGGDGPITSSASVRAPVSRPTSELRSTGTIRSRWLASFSSNKVGGAAGAAAFGSTGESESGTESGSETEGGSASGGQREGKINPAATEAAATAEGREAEWVRSLLLSAAGLPGLVVDLWSPGPAFLRHVEVGLPNVFPIHAFVQAAKTKISCWLNARALQ